MADSVASDAGTGSGGSNKRKSPDPVVENPVDHPPVPTDLSEFKFPAPRSEKARSDGESVEVESGNGRSGEEAKLSEWDDPIVCQIEELLSSTLLTAFKNAVKKIVECGYEEDVAERAISRQGLYLGGKDPVSIIVSHTLDFLQKGKKRDASADPLFENLEQLAKYTMLEMVSVLREIKPFLSIAEALWMLLVYDLNISAACVAKGDILRGSGSREGSSSASPQQKSEAQTSEAIPSKPNEANYAKLSLPSSQSHSPGTLRFGSLPDNLFCCEGKTPAIESSVSSAVQILSQLNVHDEKSVAARRGRARKELVALRAKSLNVDKFRSSGKGSNRSGKLSAFLVEKRIKNPSEIPPMLAKNISLKRNAKSGTSAGVNHQVSTNTSGGVLVKDNSLTSPAIFASSATDSKVAVSSSSEKKSAPTNADCDAERNPGIPCDESLGKGKNVSKEDKDQLIVKLALRLRDLQKEKDAWTEWAHAKVMQATRRLSEDQAELKALRQEKEEGIQFSKEKQMMNENTLKRMSEMEQALSNAGHQVEQANMSIQKLELENAALKIEMEAAGVLAKESAACYNEALEREKTALKDVQSSEAQKTLLQDELEAQKKNLADLQKQEEKAKNLYNQTEARWKRTREKNQKILDQAAAIRKEREILEAEAKAEEDELNLKAESQKQKNIEEIQRLQNEIAALRIKQDSSRIAALRRSTDSGFGMFSSSPSTGNQIPSSTPNIIRSGDLKRERECVMCLSEEKVVVFLPCAHQVLCAKCNEKHETEMKECPTCRTPIQRRILVHFRQPKVTGTLNPVCSRNING